VVYDPIWEIPAAAGGSVALAAMDA